MARDRVQTRSVARRTRHRLLFVNPLGFALGCQFVFKNGITGVFRAGLLVAVPDFAETTAFFAGAMRRIEGEEARIEFFKSASAPRTAHLRAHHGQTMFGIEQVRRAAPDVERALDEIARFQDPLRVDRADHDIDRVLLEALELSEL